MHDIVVAITLHIHKLSRRTTWHSSGEKYKNQIDYILIDKNFRWSIKTSKAGSFPGADIGNDHDLVMTIKVKMKNVNKSNSVRLKFDIEKLNDPLVEQELETNRY